MHSLINVERGEVWTTSLLVADKFEKRHDNVMRGIRNLECSPDFRLLNFEEIEYVDSRGRKMPAHRISRDGFTMLAMAFTGSAAAKWRETFIRAFNEMERRIRYLSALKADPEWQQIRSSGKVVRLDLTDAVQEFVKYATSQGSKSAEKYYMSITKMEYKALFMVSEAVGKGFRDSLTARQGSYLTAAETIARKAIREGMSKKMHYKDIYQLAKEHVEMYSGLLGKTLPGDDRPMLLS